MVALVLGEYPWTPRVSLTRSFAVVRNVTRNVARDRPLRRALATRTQPELVRRWSTTGAPACAGLVETLT